MAAVHAVIRDDGLKRLTKHLACLDSNGTVHWTIFNARDRILCSALAKSCRSPLLDKSTMIEVMLIFLLRLRTLALCLPLFLILQALPQLVHAKSMECDDSVVVSIERTIKVYSGSFFDPKPVRCQDSAKAKSVFMTLGVLSQLRFGNTGNPALFNQSLIAASPWDYFVQAFGADGVTIWLGSDECSRNAQAIGNRNGIFICDHFYESSLALQMAILMHEARHVHSRRSDMLFGTEHVSCERGKSACDVSLRLKGAYAVAAEFLSKLSLYGPSEQIQRDASVELETARSWFVLDPFEEMRLNDINKNAYTEFGKAAFRQSGVWYHRATEDVSHSLFHLLRSSFKAAPYCEDGSCDVKLLDMHCAVGEDELDINCRATNQGGRVETKISKIDLANMMMLVQQLKKNTSMNEIAAKSLSLPFDLVAIQCEQYLRQDANWGFSCRALAQTDEQRRAARARDESSVNLEPETETLEKPYASLRRVSVSRLEDGKRFVSAYILFRPGSAKLTSAEQAKLEEFARSAKKMKIALIIAEGYSNRDETSGNKIRALASDRAHLVKEFLVSFGLDRDRIYEEGSGIPERIPQVDTLMNAQRGGFVELSAEQAPVPAN